MWSRRARGEGSGGEVEKALISQKELALDLKAMRVWLFESGGSFIYITCNNELKNHLFETYTRLRHEARGAKTYVHIPNRLLTT